MLYNKIPVLFLVFNRYEETCKSFARIFDYKPNNLYINIDGPRNVYDKEQITLIIQLFSTINWDCKINIRQNANNLGCKTSVSEAINWFFDNEEFGAIIEDDIVVSNKFFQFVERCHSKYNLDESVQIICGTNYVSWDISHGDYLISDRLHIWGWATWAKFWKNYDVNITDWPEVKNSKSFIGKFNSIKEYLFWRFVFDNSYKKNFNAWSYQLLYLLWKTDVKTILPRIPLIENIGFNEKGTHTKSSVPLFYYFDNDDLAKFDGEKKVVYPIPHDLRNVFGITWKSVIYLKIYDLVKSKFS